MLANLRCGCRCHTASLRCGSPTARAPSVLLRLAELECGADRSAAGPPSPGDEDRIDWCVHSGADSGERTCQQHHAEGHSGRCSHRYRRSFGWVRPLHGGGCVSPLRGGGYVRPLCGGPVRRPGAPWWALRFPRAAGLSVVIAVAVPLLVGPSFLCPRSAGALCPRAGSGRWRHADRRPCLVVVGGGGHVCPAPARLHDLQ